MGRPSEADESLRERIKIAIQTAQDQGGRLLYFIPPGVAGTYADAIMRALSAWDDGHDCHETAAVANTYNASEVQFWRERAEAAELANQEIVRRHRVDFARAERAEKRLAEQ